MSMFQDTLVLEKLYKQKGRYIKTNKVAIYRLLDKFAIEIMTSDSQ